jgi:uncharacterized protein YoxC
MFNRAVVQLTNTQHELDEKEKRFQKSINKNKDIQKTWGNKFAELNKQIEKIQGKTDKIDQAATDIDDVYNSVMQRADEIEDKYSEIATKAENIEQQNQNQLERMWQYLKQLEMNKASATDVTPRFNLPKKTQPQPSLLSRQDQNQEVVNMNENVNLPISFADSESDNKKPVVVQPEEPQGYDNQIETAIDDVMPWFEHFQPLYYKQFSKDEIKKAMRRSIGPALLIYAPDIEEEHIESFSRRVAYLLKKQAEKDVKPKDNYNPDQGKLFSESLLCDFENILTDITKNHY